MGDDGHIVSIFPKSKELKKKFVCKPIYRDDFKRLTLGLNIINNSKKILLWLNNNGLTGKIPSEVDALTADKYFGGNNLDHRCSIQ